jgi:hypothetical protein
MRCHRVLGLVFVWAAVATGCSSEDAIAPLSTTPPASARPEPGATHGVGGLTPLTVPRNNAGVDEATAAFYDQIRTAFRVAQARVYTLQESDQLEPLSTYRAGPSVFPAPGWAQFFDDQAGLVHETASRLRDAALIAPDPAVFAALIDPWEAELAGEFEALADAARRSDDGMRYQEVIEDRRKLSPSPTLEPDADSLRQYLIALPGYNEPVVVSFGPDAGR